MSIRPLRIVFCGTPDFAVPSLLALIDDDRFVVELVITQPDKPVGRKQELTAPAVKRIAELHDLPVWQPMNVSAEMQECPLKDPPDFLVVVAYGQILKQHVLDWPIVAPVNVHASLLPRLRGAAPMQHALLAGDTETGVTIQQMVAKLDQGPILEQQSYAIGKEDTIVELHDTLAEMGASLLCTTISNPLNPQEQDHDRATICKKMTRTIGNVNASTMTAEEIHRHVRALVPWPGVRMEVQDEEVKLLKTSLVETGDCISVTCKDDTTLFIEQLQSPGRKPLSALEWSRGK